MVESRVSLIEKYNNKDVITQIALLKDQCNDTTDLANSTKEYVDRVAGEAEEATRKANTASAVAQNASATANQASQTAMGMDTRVTTLEGNAVKLNPEQGASAHQKIVGGIESDEMQTDNLNVLETVDADTVQSHALNVIDSAVVPNTANGSVSQYAVNAKRLMEEPSIVRTTGNQNIADAKYFTSNLGGKKLNAISVSTSERYGQERTWLCVDKDNNAVVTSFVTNETDSIENGFSFKLGNGNGVVLDCYLYVVANTRTGSCSLNFFDTKGKITTLNQWTDERLIR